MKKGTKKSDGLFCVWYNFIKESAICKRETEMKFMWFIFALLSAIFASLTSILAKIGIDGVNSNLATAIRTVVVVMMAWGMVFFDSYTKRIIRKSVEKAGYFLILSGLATGASWLCYYRALQMGKLQKLFQLIS